ncbi:acyl-CoA dehydrogenase family protein [Microbacterium sp. MC2]
MSFEPDEDQLELVALVRDVLEQHADSAATRRAIESAPGFDVELWRLMREEIGVAGLAIPEQYGGAGYTLREQQLVLEEIGRSLAPSPYLGSVAIAAQAILATEDVAAAERLLPSIADGTLSAALAWADPSGRFTPDRIGVRARPKGSAWTLDGSVGFVLDGDIADVLLVIAMTEAGPRLFEVAPTDGVTRERVSTMDQTLRLTALHFADVDAHPVGEADARTWERIQAVALASISAVQAGTSASALEMTVAYAKQRVQFGRQIGSFQAIKHRLADMHVRVEVAVTASRGAAAALADGTTDRLALAKVAKAVCSDSLSHVASETIQLHGGIAITWEHDAHLVFKRAHALGQLFGTAHEQRAAAADWALQRL